MVSIMLHVSAINWYNIICSVLSRLVLGVLHPLVSKYTPLSVFQRLLHPPMEKLHPPMSVSEAAEPPIGMMACKADLYSIVITKLLYTCKYTAIDCTIVTLAVDRGWIRE